MNRAQRRTANKINRQRLPARMTDIPREQWPAAFEDDFAKRIRVLVNRRYLVQVSQGDGCLRLSVNRIEAVGHSWRGGVSWDELQQIKQDAGYGDRWAVEIFPADGHVVDVAAMRHLWLLPEKPAFAW